MKRLCLVITALLLSFCAAFAQDISAQSEKKKKIEQEISFIDKQLKNLNSKQKATRANLALIQKRASNRKAIISGLDTQISATEKQIAEKNTEIQQLQAEIDTLSAYYSKLIYNAYKNRDTKVWFMYVLASEDIGQGYRRLSYLKNLAGTVNGQAIKIEAKRKEIEEEKSKLEAIVRQTNSMKADREKEYNKLLAEEKESQKVIKDIARNQNSYKKELAKKKREVAKLNSEIQRMIAAAIEKERQEKARQERERLAKEKPSQTTQPGTETAKSAPEKSKSRNLPVDDKLSGSFAQNKGRLGWPVSSGVITEKFGVHFHPVYKNIQLPESNGITISTTRGAEVHSVFEGSITKIVMMPGYGQCILVQHGEYFTFYCKLGRVTVKAGQKVSTGQVLGYLEADGQGSSIHFQIWKGTQKQNPEAWLRN